MPRFAKRDYFDSTLGLNPEELRTIRSLSSPIKIQKFLDALPINHEKAGETTMSPRRVLREQKAHCMEGALLAATALWLSGERPLLLDLKSARGDDDHVVTLYRINGYFGAISKTNHATLRFRDPIYKTVRELALSYFHEYFLNSTGKKTLRFYSAPFDLRAVGIQWVTAKEELFGLARALDKIPHFPLVPKKNTLHLRKADAMERKAGSIVEWPESNPRT